MTPVELEVSARQAEESPDALRKRGAVPAVFYGAKEKSTPIAIDSRKLERIWKEAGETTIVKIKGLGEEKDALIHDVQIHPVTGALQHADFYVLEKGKKVTLNIPLKFEGTAPAEKAGHIIIKALHEIEIEVAPADIPHDLPVNLATLQDVGDHITAKDISLPASAELITSPDEIVASVKEFVEEAEEIAPAPETVIEGEEKKEGESAEDGQPEAKKEGSVKEAGKEEKE